LTEEAVDALYRAHARPVLKVLMSLGWPLAASEDAVHEAFLRLLQLDAAPSNPLAWLCQVARRVASDARRKGGARGAPRRTVQLTPVIESIVGDPVPTALEAVVQEEQLAAMRYAMNLMNPKDRDLLVRWSQTRRPGRGGNGKRAFTAYEDRLLTRARRRLRAVAA